MNSNAQDSPVGSENPNGDYPAEHYAALLRGLVHKLNNVLTILTGHSGLLLLENGLPKEVKSQLQQMADSAMALSRYIDQASLLTRPAAVELKTLLVSELLVSLPVPSGLSFSHSGDAGITGDAQKLRLVFAEVLRNAAQAHATQVELAIQPAGDRAKLRFRDNGPGIRPEQLSRIFDPFFTTQKQPSAFGLGLFRIRGELQRMSGNIAIDSDGKSYSEVVIELPAAAVDTGD